MNTKRLAVVFACWLAVVAPAPAEEPSELAELRARVEKLEAHNRELAEADAKRKADEAEAKSKVSDPPNLKVGWDNGLLFLSDAKDWKIHVGGRFQGDAVWWRQPASLKGPPPGPGGIPASQPGDGLGPLDDGTYFRRVRFKADGTLYQHTEFNIEINFENITQIAFDHMWVGWKDLPYLNTVRVGQMKVPQGLEAISSDYHFTFLERSALSDAFWNLFAPGIQIANTYFDQHVTTQMMFHRLQPNQPYNGSDFGDGDYAFTTRLTGTPVYAGGGEHVIHVGGSYQYRTGDLGREFGGTGNAFADTQRVVRFRDRPELRDAVGSVGNPARFTDTGFLLAEGVHLAGPELLVIWGPFSFQSEAALSLTESARSIYPAADFNRPRGDPFFWGTYAQVSYFLTGEHRGYDRRFGAFDRPKVRRPFAWFRGDDGCVRTGPGAWEIAYRYSYTDLNDNGINGGQFNEQTLGLNWYLNDNTKLQVNYLNAMRNVAAPANSGTVHGLGARVQFYF